MRDFQDSTLWEVSGFEEARRTRSQSCYTGQLDTTALPSTLQGELDELGRLHACGDVLEVMTALRRHSESALVYLIYERLVWPVTVFPCEMLYYSPRDLLGTTTSGLRTIHALSVEPPGVLPPSAWAGEPELTACYRPLAPVLWRLALEGPRGRLLRAIGGAAAYRLLHDPVEDGDLPSSSGVAAALRRLGRRSASLAEIASWPGMGVERSARMLNALYLIANLMVTRASPAARREPRFGFLRRPQA